MDIGELINVYRKEARMTIDELVASSGVSRGTITKIISGVTKAPTLDNVKAIARALGRPLSDFDDDDSHLSEFSFAEREHIKKYRVLDVHGKRIVDGALDLEYDRMTHVVEREEDEHQKAVIRKEHLSGKTERIFRAARSEDNTPPEWVDMPVEEVERIFNAPESKTNL